MAKAYFSQSSEKVWPKTEASGSETKVLLHICRSNVLDNMCCYVVQVVPDSKQLTSERELLVQLILKKNDYEHHIMALFFYYVQKYSRYSMEISWYNQVRI